MEDGGRHGCNYLGHQICAAMRAAVAETWRFGSKGGERQGREQREQREREEKKLCVISRRPCGRPRSSKRPDRISIVLGDKRVLVITGAVERSAGLNQMSLLQKIENKSTSVETRQEATMSSRQRFQ